LKGDYLEGLLRPKKKKPAGNQRVSKVVSGERGIILNLSQPFLKYQEISSLFSEAL
jgi:hypothetical protein